MSKDWNFPSDQFKSLPLSSVRSKHVIEPILMIVLLFLFILNPETYLKWSVQVKVLDKLSSSTTTDNTISSANWFIFFSLLLCMIPFILELHLIAIASISTVFTKRHGDNEQPCLTPLGKLNPTDMCPLFMIPLLGLVYRISIHLVKYSGKLINLIVFCIKWPFYSIKSFVKVNEDQ